jgi:hypothetical protein
MTKKTKDHPPHEDAVTTARKVPGVPFKCGGEWTGNAKGRPKGSKHKLSEEFVAALCEDFKQHGVAVIEAVRTERPADYLKIIASIVPKEVNVSASSLDDLSDDDLFDALEVVRALMAGTAKPRKSKPLAN